MGNIENLINYTILQKKELKEVDGTGYVLSHNKTKARVMVIENKDNNKVFNIGFRTPPFDDCGTAHIMEHSVLCGSKKFPVKDPFVELCKGSLNTFLNAMTYSDKTVYPVASLNATDFHNLMHVYLDAVFYPKIFEREEILMQEGWHYELDENDALIYNGVVYNEMKGVYSSPEEQLYRIIESSLLPDTAYSFESGGDPEYIPDLTREKFLEFHDRYYHPSNSYIYLYGNMDAEKELDFIDREYLSSYDYLYVPSELKEQEEFVTPRRITEQYSLSEAEDEAENTYLSYNVVVGKSTEKELCLAIAVIEHALLVAPGAPVKKALIDAGIGKDVYSSYDDALKQPTFSIIAKNANADDEKKFIEIIDTSLKDIVENGFNKKSLQAAINYFEFKHKEANYGRYPKGLMLGLSAFGTWLYDDDQALTLFELNDTFDSLKKKLDEGYFEDVVKKCILENTHKSYVVFEPKKGLNEEREAKVKEKLAAYKAQLSDAALDEIRKKAKQLKEYQSTPSTPEELAKIPMLAISDIDRSARKINNAFSTIEKVLVVHNKIFTNGISYLSLNFDITDLEYAKLPYVALLTEIFKYVDTEHYGYNELANEINIHTGDIGFMTALTSKKEPHDYVLQFVVSAKMLDDKLDKAMELIDEILFTSAIDDKKRLMEIVAETKANLKNGLISGGHLTAATRALSYVSPIGVIKELTEGIDYYNFICDCNDNFEERYDGLAATLKETLSEILRRDSLSVSFISDKSPEVMLKESITGLSKKLSTRLRFDETDKKEPAVLNEGFKTASQVQYVATAGNFLEKGLTYNGRLLVLQSIFSYDYLWNNVRVKGGAYGCMCSFSRSGNGYFTSYRDPNLMETYEIYKKASEYVRGFDADERDMTKYIIGAISKLDAPLTPQAEGNFSYVAYLMGLDDEELQRNRDEVLGADVAGIRALAPYIEAVTEGGVICAIGDEKKIEANADGFSTVLSLS